MNALHPLGQLFQSVEDAQGWSLREIGRRIERTGRKMSYAYVARLKKEPVSSITYETIRALAVGLDVPERVVGLAALESMGVHDVDPTEIGAAASIARAPDLTERDRRILLAAVREMQRGQDDGQQDPPGERAGASAEGGGVARDAERDGITPARPWEREDFDLAAKPGRNRGREVRLRQDDEGEAGGA